jgi:hypothetical protein
MAGGRKSSFAKGGAARTGSEIPAQHIIIMPIWWTTLLTPLTMQIFQHDA